MKKITGFILLFIACFLLGMAVNSLYFSNQQELSPIPNNDGVRVLFLSPQPTAKTKVSK